MGKASRSKATPTDQDPSCGRLTRPTALTTPSITPGCPGGGFTFPFPFCYSNLLPAGNPIEETGFRRARCDFPTSIFGTTHSFRMYNQWSFKLLSTLGALFHILFIDLPSDLWRFLTAKQKVSLSDPRRAVIPFRTYGDKLS